MRHRIIAIVILLFAGRLAWAETTVKDTATFGAWKVTIAVDDFEDEVKPTLVADVNDINGNKIGRFSIGYFTSITSKFDWALVSIYIDGLDGTWPKCDYEFMKYKIDRSSSSYFPKTGYACPSLMFNSAMESKFKRGLNFRFSASGRTGVVDLTGFTKAWNYTINNLKAGS